MEIMKSNTVRMVRDSDDNSERYLIKQKKKTFISSDVSDQNIADKKAFFKQHGYKISRISFFNHQNIPHLKIKASKITVKSQSLSLSKS